MGRLPLLPYALVSMAIVVASTVTVTVSAGRRAGAPSSTAPAELAPSGATPTLSLTGRLAYWRADGGAIQLWVSDIDGSRKWPVAHVSSADEVGLTRWTPDGEAIGYVLVGSTFVVVGLDGREARYAMPSDVPADGRKIVRTQWSPDGARVALSLRSASGVGNDSDVWLLDLGSGRWKRLTTLGDAVAGPWVDADRLLVETFALMLATVDTTTGALSPITGMSGASPVLGSDGRIYFAGGSGGGAVPMAAGPFTYGWIWSMSASGDDIRQETQAWQGPFRLEARWPDGRFAIGIPGAVYIMGPDDVSPLPFHAGTIRRVHVMPDGRRAIGLTDSRVLRLDIEKLSGSVPIGSPHPGIAVLLDGVREADVWSPHHAVEIARSPEQTDAKPVRLAFVLGGSAWLVEPTGPIRQLATRPSMRGWVSTPSWSPDGQRLAVAVSEGGGPMMTSTVVVLDREGRWVGGFSGSEPIAWAPDSRSLAVSLVTTTRVGGSDRSQWEILVHDLEHATPTARLAGRQPLWTPKGLMVLGNGEQSGWWATRQPVEIVTASARRTITTTEQLASHPLIARLPGSDLVPTISQMSASADGSLLAVWLSRLDPRSEGIRDGAIAIVRTSDGVPIVAVANDPRTGVFGARWSPRGPYLGHTVTASSASPAMPAPPSRAIVRDARTWAVVVEVDGRFAGWAPDGDAFYVSRNEGLFAYRLDGTGGARVSRFGVDVRAARP